MGHQVGDQSEDAVATLGIDYGYMNARAKPDAEDGEEDLDAIVQINAKAAFMAVGTLEKICSRLDCNIVLGDNKDKPMSLTVAAEELKASPQFSRQ